MMKKDQRDGDGGWGSAAAAVLSPGGLRRLLRRRVCGRAAPCDYGIEQEEVRD